MKKLKVRLAIVTTLAMGTLLIPASPAQAMCNIDDGILEQVVCGAYGAAGSLICKVTKGGSCIT